MEDIVAQRSAELRARNGQAHGLTPLELAKRFRSLKKEYLAKQRDKATHVLAANRAALEQYLTHRLQGADSRWAGPGGGLPIPRLGDGQTDTPGSLAPLAPPPKLRTAQLLPLPLSDRRVGVRQGPAQSGHVTKLHVRSLPAVQPPPSYTTWSYLKRNELARDHGRRMFLVDELGETVPADDGETEERLPWEDADGAAVDWAMARLAGEYGWEDPDVLEGLMEALRPQPQPEAIAQRLAYLQRQRLPDESRGDMEVEEVLDAFVGSFCRRCRIYGCRTHSGGHVKPHHRPAPLPADASARPCGPSCWRLAVAAAGAAGSAGAAAAGAAAAGGAAEGSQAMEVDGEEAAAGAGPGSAADGVAAAAAVAGGGASKEWTTYELSLVRQGIQVFGAGNPCMVAVLIGPGRTCAEVRSAMDRIEAEARRGGGAGGAGGAAGVGAGGGGANAGGGGGELDGGYGGAAGAGGGGGGGAGVGGADAVGLSRVPARRKGGRTKKTLLTNKSERSLVVNSRAQHGPNDPWQEYQPCTCMGKCKADCPCVRAHNFCEKFCACSPACKERFKGCNCKSGCKNNQCPCSAAGRECDPDLCCGCAPTLEGRAEPGRECHNMRLRMRQHAHVVLGTSDIPGAGWGLFAAQHVSKNGFLGEYTGDLITQDEANRRGSVYDHMNNSYLFNLNTEWVVDAKFRGNKLRCANHSHEPVAKAKVLLVDGESRIAIFADKPVYPGMEITYDYRYSEDTAPHWVKKKHRS
ncbi:hypothetical protein HYH03_008850 [Edaphochlamys debaryana]|uniref:Uncharacterized protein n=1 Tax=Edaphochlamys debaryana TaxID=47281 RepID=A0A836BYG2_9CHLO|nr:hypothetical protein HYH03_008850 [Edaphochlamys debaryana]|eukprot:KAG2492942.1 hypothetical protein HYH03_008850 [Edaphochlamys debaryana]